MPDSTLHIAFNQKDGRIHIKGALDIYHFQQAKEELAHIGYKKARVIDLSNVTHLDTAGALLLYKTLSTAKKAKHPLELEHLHPSHTALFDMVAQTNPGKPPAIKHVSPWKQMLVRLGKAAIASWPATIEFITFMGQACIALVKALRHPGSLRFASITHHIEAIGINAIPIIALIAFVISVVIAYQGQVQLKPLGVERYTVNLIAISVLREMGVLLTAIMIAGRSGSAFTAEIGTMKVHQEIDALRSIGFNPFELLVLPRLIALVIVLPLLTLLADIMGLFGGAIISISLIDVSIPEYLERARHVLTGEDFFVGMIKAPVFAVVIALVGCMHGLKASGSSGSVGKETTASVVKSIFLVLMLDGLFSIYFEKMGL